MATSKSDAPRRRDITTISETQFMGDMFVQTSDVLRVLRRQCRLVCGLPEVSFDAPIMFSEAHVIFTICYVRHNGPSIDWSSRTKRSLTDLEGYVRGHSDDKLPYYVVRSFQQGILPEHLPGKLITYYREAIILLQHAVPEYGPESKHLLPHQHG